MKKRLKIILLLIFGLVLVFFLTWQFLKPRKQSNIPFETLQNLSSTVNIRLKWLWYSGWAGELVADSNDIWRKNNITVNLQPGGFELDPIKLVAAGTDQIGIAGADQILMAREKGIPLVAFAVQYQESPVGFAVKKNSGILNIEGFRGKRIGVKYGTDIEPVYRSLLARNKILKNEVTEVAVKFDLTPFLAGSVDVYPGYLTNDLLLAEEKGSDVVLLQARDFGINVYGNVYFCTENFLKNNRQVVLAVLRSLLEGWAQALSFPGEKIADLAIKKNNSLVLSHEIRVANSLKPYIQPAGIAFGSMTEQGWHNVYDLLRQNGILKNDLDYRKAFSLEILNEITKPQ